MQILKLLSNWESKIYFIFIYLQKIVRQAKKEFACNGTVVEHPEYGEVLQLQGDQRTKVSLYSERLFWDDS